MSVGLDRVLSEVMRLHPKVIDLGLARVHTLLERVGHPERRLPLTVHIAGTNGKGSTLAYLESMARCAGLRVHAYTSPHLVRFCERIRLGGRMVEEARYLATLEACRRANGDDAITFFEITTVAALLLFAEEAADLLVLETGLGGRLDATNVVSAPVVSVLTPIALDHKEYLGSTLGAIAGEKAGILKRGCPVVSAAQPKAAREVIVRRAREQGARLWLQNRDWRGRCQDGEQKVVVDGGLELACGRAEIGYQEQNLATALATVLCLREEGLDIPTAAVREGAASMRWPGRWQRLRPRTCLAGWSVRLDGGHNGAAARALAAACTAWQDEDSRPLSVICGMLIGKDPGAFFRALSPQVSRVLCVEIPEHHSFTAAQLQGYARRAGLPASGHKGWQEAAQVLEQQEPPGRLLICGSLYLCGLVLSRMEEGL